MASKLPTVLTLDFILDTSHDVLVDLESAFSLVQVATYQRGLSLLLCLEELCHAQL